LPDKRRNLILSAAAAELGAHGYKGASLNRVLANANVSKGAAYYYFDNKADLFGALITEYWRLELGVIDVDPAEVTAQSFWPSLERIYASAQALGFSHPWLIHVEGALWILPSEVADRPEVAEAFGRYYSYIERLFSRGRDLGVVRTDAPIEMQLELVGAIDRAFSGWLVKTWDTRTPQEVQRLTTVTIEMLRAMLMP